MKLCGWGCAVALVTCRRMQAVLCRDPSLCKLVAESQNFILAFSLLWCLIGLENFSKLLKTCEILSQKAHYRLNADCTREDNRDELGSRLLNVKKRMPAVVVRMVMQRH